MLRRPRGLCQVGGQTRSPAARPASVRAVAGRGPPVSASFARAAGRPARPARPRGPGRPRRPAPGRAVTNASSASRARAAVEPALGLGQVALEPLALERRRPRRRSRRAGRRPRSRRRPSDDRQVAAARRRLERLGRQLAVERPRAGEPLDGRPERLERRRRGRPARRRSVSSQSPAGSCAVGAGVADLA